MPMAIEQWQERLERHFTALAALRSSSGFPIFALEHNLADDEVTELADTIQDCFTSESRPYRNWLPWVVYATEVGYRYTGDEYWPLFEEHAPGWSLRDRDRVSPWFRKFETAYRGVRPSGRWAGHFRVIAWPITHAILPRYLQHQFARALYDLRFRLASFDSDDPGTIGRLVAANVHHASSRFEEFLQQEELTGRIVLGLLGEAPGEGEEPIHLPTLDRIVRDLERVRSAKKWLKETRRVVRDRFKGVARISSSGQSRASGRRPYDIAHADIRPSLFLRYSGDRTWSVVIEVPGFRGMPGMTAEIRGLLKRTRCRVNGAPDVKPAGWLLSGTRTAVLRSWPDVDRPLLQLEKSSPAVDQLLESECRLRGGQPWLFRIAPDGLAREIVGRIVRPGLRYVVAAQQTPAEAHAMMGDCQIDCSGVAAFLLSVPSDVSASDMEWLKGIGLQVARTVRLWPAGLCARGWDGEGHAEWLTTESPCFGIANDHPVEAFTFRLDGGAMETISAGPVGTPTFVRLPALPAGAHSLEVKAKRSPELAGLVAVPGAEGLVELKVREPEIWSFGEVGHSGLVVTLDPPEPDLDQFWENETRLTVQGPSGYRVSFEVSLSSADGRKLLSERVNGSVELPVKPEAWTRIFREFRNRGDHGWRQIEAAAGCLTIRGGELGEFVAQFDRELLPVRWVARRSHRKFTVRLIDDSGREGSEPEAQFYGMSRPLERVPCDVADARAGLEVEQPGGLFIAQHGDHGDQVVASVGPQSGSLRDLNVAPSVEAIARGAVSIGEALRVFQLWNSARLAGFLAEIRKKTIVEAILASIYERICGANWARAETAYRANPQAQTLLEALKRSVARQNGFAAVLCRDFREMDDKEGAGVEWFATRAARFAICTDRNLCEFALRLAGTPGKLTRFGEHKEKLLEGICDEPALLRGARLLAVLCAAAGKASPGDLLPEWAW